ncbi:MAG TPA: hypothetical protein VII02_04170 [Gemmatimonadaceae bacterium]
MLLRLMPLTRSSLPFTYLLMRIVSNICGVLLLIVGCVWFLQGINVLPGSFMTGQTKWALYGGLSFVAGIGLLVRVNRRQN